MAGEASSQPNEGTAGASDAAGDLIPPLAPGNRSHVAPYRDKDVIAEITTLLLDDDVKNIVQRANIHDPDREGYIRREETFVFLIRHFRDQRRSELAEVFSEALIRRCKGSILRTISDPKFGFSSIDAANLACNALSLLFMRILDPVERTSGNFLQSRFWSALEFVILDTISDALKERERSKQIRSLDDAINVDDDETISRGYDSNPSSGRFRTLLTLPLDYFAQINEGLRVITQTDEQPYRAVFIMREYLDFPVGDKDWVKPCIARRFDRSRKTIQNWYNEAEHELAAWRRGPDDREN